MIGFKDVRSEDGWVGGLLGDKWSDTQEWNQNILAFLGWQWSSAMLYETEAFFYFYENYTQGPLNHHEEMELWIK